MASPPRTTAWRAAGDETERFQRLVANPFLAMAGVVGWLAALMVVTRSGRFEVILPVFASLALVWLLPQYHCLDCGSTGRLTRWRQHCCGRVRDRIAASRPRRFRGPKPTTQAFLWVVAAVGVFVLCLTLDLVPID